MKKYLIPFILVLFSLSAYAGKHTTVVISLDGCRWDYPLWYDTPFLDYMSERGVTSGLIPSFPSKTFPNHYTLATGLYPDHHGIVANTFLDPPTGEVYSLSNLKTKSNPRFYGGEPIWLTAKRQGLKTAVFYWPGSDVKIHDSYPDHFYPYDVDQRLSFSQRLDGIIADLSKPESERPQLIMAYLEQPDSNGHNYGPQSRETRNAVQEVDALLRRLYFQIQALPAAADVNFIVVSDHGMAWVEPERRIDITPYLKPAWVAGSTGSIPESIYANEGYADSVYYALQGLDHVRVWRKGDVPEYLHYGTNSRIGDVLVLPDLGYIVRAEALSASGQHGYDPTFNDMHAIFRAVGPDFRHVTLPHFANVHFYSLLCRLLGILPAPNDGTIEPLVDMLQVSD